MVYVLEGLPSVTEGMLEKAMEFLSSQRREKVTRYRFHKDRVQSAFACLLLRYALKQEVGFVGLPLLDETEGKPILKEPKGLHFNLSHCSLAAACGLCYQPVGVDVQDWTPRHLSVAKKVCAPAELRILEQSAEPEKDFARLWTRKESYGKYTGQGIHYSMKEKDLTEDGLQGVIMETVDFPGFALSYCGEKKLELAQVTVQELLEGGWAE